MSGITTVLSTKSFGTTEKITLKRYGDGTLEYVPQTITTGTTVSGSPNISAVVSTLGWVKGMAISGAGIPAGATLVSFVPNTSAVISANASASASGVALTVTKVRNAGGPGFRTQSAAVDQGWVVALFAALQITA